MKYNILMLVADQFRGDTMACMGHPDIQTPHLDQLAKDGTLFLNGHTPDPICVPARATMITGKYPHKCTGRKENAGSIYDGVVKMPEYLSQHGYKTYSSGKLHYLPYTKPGEQRTLHGFEQAKITESGRMLAQFDPKNELGGVEDYIDYLTEVGYKGYSRAHGIGNNDPHPAASPLPQEHNVDAWVASTAIQYLDQHIAEESEKPFFLHASFPKPHAPYDPPRPYDAMYDPRKIQIPAQRGNELERSFTSNEMHMTHGLNYLSPEAIQVSRAHYYGLISFQDHQIGRLLQALKDHGVYDQTIIVFVADHGDMMGDFGYFFKSNMYKGSVHIPFVVKLPSSEKKMDRSDALVGLQDLFPTICDYCGLKMPEGLDGKSLKSEIETGKGDRKYYVSYTLESPNQNYMIRDQRHKYIYQEEQGKEELYDLQEDPREENNIIALNPMLAQKLKSELLKWIEASDDREIMQDADLVKSTVKHKSEFHASSMGWRWY